MNASEIKYLEEQLHSTWIEAPLVTMPSPEHMVNYQAKVRHERNEHLAALLMRGLQRVGGWVSEVRKIAQACTAARLHLPAA